MANTITDQTTITPMTEPLPTDALRRLAAVVPEQIETFPPTDDEQWAAWYYGDHMFLETDAALDHIIFNHIIFNHIIAQALLPWVAVPCGEEVVLVRIERRTPTMGSPWSVPYWYCEGAESMGRVVNTAMDYTGATRFPDPLTALESIKKP